MAVRGRWLFLRDIGQTFASMAFRTKREGEAPADPLRLLFFQPRFCATSAKHSRPWHFRPNGRGRLPPTLCACCFFNHDFARHRPNIRAYGISGQTGGGGSRRPLRLLLFQPRMDTNRHEYLNSGFRPTSSQQCPKYNALYSCPFVVQNQTNSTRSFPRAGVNTILPDLA